MPKVFALPLSLAAIPCVLAVGSLFTGDTARAEPGGVDPLAVRVELDDAERFAALFRATNGKPSADDLERVYIGPGTRAVRVFTPDRIISAQNLAEVIESDPAFYKQAIDRCLPWVRMTEPDLRSIYLAFGGLLPEKPLPRIAVVFGARNSGGTAQPDMQVLGLEVLCHLAPDEASFRRLMRSFYAHETVHSLQRLEDSRLEADPLLAAAIAEGTADYIAALVTGSTPDPERARWAEANEAFVWAQFAQDVAIMRDDSLPPDQRQAAFRRWIGNAGSPPEGWPSELGYWVGMRIAEGYVANAPDRAAAIRQLLTFDDPRMVLAQSGITLAAPALGSPH